MDKNEIISVTALFVSVTDGSSDSAWKVGTARAFSDLDSANREIRNKVVRKLPSHEDRMPALANFNITLHTSDGSFDSFCVQLLNGFTCVYTWHSQEELGQMGVTLNGEIRADRKIGPIGVHVGFVEVTKALRTAIKNDRVLRDWFHRMVDHGQRFGLKSKAYSSLRGFADAEVYDELLNFADDLFYDKIWEKIVQDTMREFPDLSRDEAEDRCCCGEDLASCRDSIWLIAEALIESDVVKNKQGANRLKAKKLSDFI